jgi:hypothetical protein
MSSGRKRKSHRRGSGGAEPTEPETKRRRRGASPNSRELWSGGYRNDARVRERYGLEEAPDSDRPQARHTVPIDDSGDVPRGAGDELGREVPGQRDDAEYDADTDAFDLALQTRLPFWSSQFLCMQQQARRYARARASGRRPEDSDGGSDSSQSEADEGERLPTVWEMSTEDVRAHNRVARDDEDECEMGTVCHMRRELARPRHRGGFAHCADPRPRPGRVLSKGLCLHCCLFLLQQARYTGQQGKTRASQWSANEFRMRSERPGGYKLTMLHGQQDGVMSGLFQGTRLYSPADMYPDPDCDVPAFLERECVFFRVRAA